MPEFGLASVDTMVQEINGNVTKNFQMAYTFQKSSGGGHSMFKGVAHGAHKVAAGTRRRDPSRQGWKGACGHY